jgi:DNA-binding NarL/FixJ family response regulator
MSEGAAPDTTATTRMQTQKQKQWPAKVLTVSDGVAQGTREDRSGAALADRLAEAGFDVVGQAADAAELLAVVREQQPELVIVDIRMPPGHSTEGLEAARTIRDELPQIGILLLSAYAEVDHAMELLATMGDRVGYLLKSRVVDVDQFVDSVERIARGGSVVDPALVQELVASRRRDDPLDVLTPREHEVLGLMANGLSNSGIARRLYVAEGTVEKHVRSILLKLDIAVTAEDHRRVLAVITFLDRR